MEQKILDFLNKERVCSLTTLLLDGSPHAAAMHFSHLGQPLEIYFSTENTSRKCQGLLSGQEVKASVVLGFTEEEFKTMQLEGVIKIVSDKADLEKIKPDYYLKNPHSKKYENEPETVFLKFTPTWWRYSDYKTSPMTIISSLD
ncbi:MAG: pyridoxamine 5'-phosphate oxidase family protein [Patescibacteria group bacterium]